MACGGVSRRYAVQVQWHGRPIKATGPRGGWMDASGQPRVGRSRRTGDERTGVDRAARGIHCDCNSESRRGVAVLSGAYRGADSRPRVWTNARRGARPTGGAGGASTPDGGVAVCGAAFSARAGEISAALAVWLGCEPAFEAAPAIWSGIGRAARLWHTACYVVRCPQRNGSAALKLFRAIPLRPESWKRPPTHLQTQRPRVQPAGFFCGPTPTPRSRRATSRRAAVA